MVQPKTESTIRQALGYTVIPSVTDRSIELFLQGLDCPRSLTVWILYKNREHQQLVDLDFQAEHYRNPGSARDAYLATCFLSKADFLDLPFDRQAVAYEKFFTCEESCRLTNKRFSDLASDPLYRGQNVWLLNATRRKIKVILDGSLDEEKSSFDPVEWFESCSWGPGSSTRITGRDTSSANKFQSETGITRDLYALVGPLLGVAYPLWGRVLQERIPYWGFLEELLPQRDSISFEIGNKVLTVPKNAKTDRVIAAEPGLNVWFQLGIGRMISRRILRNTGVDLQTQERNGLLSFYASMSGSLATVDFSSASDTISTRVVEELLPSKWFSILDSCRSHCGHVKGVDKPLRYQKFSSMGNGFTFPLQTLIFLGAAMAVCELLQISDDYIGVFGDDVIIPVDAFNVYEEFCAFLGFSIGRKKSFFSGFFRESCGSHYLFGVDLKPLYLKEKLKSLESVYVHANGLRRLSRRNLSYGCDGRLRLAWKYLVNKVPKKIRFFIPEGYGDGGFIGNFDESCPSTVRKPPGQVEGYLVRQLQQIPIKRKHLSEGFLLAKLLDLGTSLVGGPSSSSQKASKNLVPLRQAVRRSVSELLAHEWLDLGPWYL